MPTGSLICGWKTHRFRTLNRPALHQLVRRVRYGYQPDPAADHRRQRVLRRDGDQRRREVDARHDVGRVLSISAADAGRRQLYDDHQCLSDLGELRCQQRRALGDQASGNWYVRNVTHTKAANLRLINTHSLAEVFINSDGVPTLGEGNADCRTQTIGSRSGLSCKMVNYTLQTNGLSNTSIHIFPAIANSSLASAVGAYDMQFSLNGSSWKPVSNTAYYYTFNEMKRAQTRSMFSSPATSLSRWSIWGSAISTPRSVQLSLSEHHLAGVRLV